LVEGLPKGSTLTAIFDSCTSGTLLDLDHYECNKVYRPWVNKGGRRSNTLRNCAVRRNYRSSQTPPSSRPNSMYGEESGEADVRFHDLIQFVMDPSPGSSLVLSAEDLNKHFGQMTASPEPQFVCDGWCRTRQPSATPEHGDVISISSSDGEISWDASTRNGGSLSMTTYLIDILRKHPGITVSGLMTRLNHRVHPSTIKMHGRVQRESRVRRKGDGNKTDSEDTESEEESKGEMNYFQDLELGSTTPVDMDQPFVF